MSLAGRVALITGAASGLGQAAAARMVANGGSVVIVDLPSSAGEAAAAALGKNAAFAPADIKEAIAMAVNKFGSLNTVVQCAGIAPPSKVVGRKGAHSLEMFQKVININLVGTFNVLRLAAEQMASQEMFATGMSGHEERGVIINTASIAAFEGQVGQCAYASSKNGVVGLMLPAARELARSGIRVNTIAPGLFKTPMMAGLPDKVQNDLAATVPFPVRLGDPDFYAQTMEFLITNPYMNGEVVRVDGALRMSA